MAKTEKTISIPLEFEDKPKEKVELAAYLFDKNGNLAEKAVVTEKSIEVKSDLNLRNLRLVIAPDTKAGEISIEHIGQMEKYRGYEASLQYGRKGISILPIPEYLSKLWILKKKCRVRGKVTKRFTIDNISQDRPLCRARVHICEVDRIWWWINRIPDIIIAKIPDYIFEPVLPRDFPVPAPDPELPIPIPLPDPAPFALSRLKKTAQTNFDTRSAIEIKKIRNSSLPVLPDELRKKIESRNLASIRQAVAENFQLFHPYFCYHPIFWPYLYRCDEIKVLYTDEHGVFDDYFTYWFWEEKPDLYFWVEYLVDDVWTTVYKPNIPCHTWWNYVCGTEVWLRVTDPRVVWECENFLPGELVWVKTVGSSASVSHIKQNSGTEIIQGHSFGNIGLSDFAPGSQFLPGLYRRPFGGNLHLVAQFSSGLPANNIYYYQWAWRKIANADLTPVANSFQTFSAEVRKGYTFEYLDIFNIKRISTNSVKLGPNTVNGVQNLFHIPPTHPDMAPFSVPESSPLWNQNTITVDINTSSLDGDGLYEFRLQLFDKNGALKTNLPRSVYQVPGFSNFGTSVNAPDNMILPNAVANVNAFTMKMRIDNANCVAEIYKMKVKRVIGPVTVWEDASADCCGFVKYNPAETGDDVEVSFRAYHPNDLATLSFGIKKGTCYDPGMSSLTNIPQVTAQNNMVIGNSNGYNRNAIGIYRKRFNHNQLLGICAANGKAAFAENLYVDALSTNGYSILDGYDRSDVAAFALEP